MPRLPRHTGNTQTLACLSLVVFVRAEDALHTPLSLLLWPCFDPMLNCIGRALCTHVWCCMCLVYGGYICTTLLRRRRCQCRITDGFCGFGLIAVVTVSSGVRGMCGRPPVSASLSKEANALHFKNDIQYLYSFNILQTIANIL